jgi:hypothetical protein
MMLAGTSCLLPKDSQQNLWWVSFLTWVCWTVNWFQAFSASVCHSNTQYIPDQQKFLNLPQQMTTLPHPVLLYMNATPSLLMALDMSYHDQPFVCLCTDKKLECLCWDCSSIGWSHLVRSPSQINIFHLCNVHSCRQIIIFHLCNVHSRHSVSYFAFCQGYPLLWCTVKPNGL